MARNLILFAVLCSLFIMSGCGGDRSTSGSNVNDTERPTNVSNFTAAGADQSVAMNWSASSDNIGVAGYRITNSTTSETRDVGAVTSYIWDSLTNDTTYTFSIVAFDGNNNISATPATDNATPYFDETAPEPVVISATSGGWDTTDTYVEISFSWSFSSSSDMSDAGAEYWISISSGDGTVWDIAQDAAVPFTQNTITVPDDPTDGRDDPIDVATFAIDTPYLIQVVAVDPHGNPSIPAQVTIIPTESADNTPPVAVSNLTGLPANQSVALTWDLLGDATYYNVYYSVSPFTTWTQYTGDSNSADNTATVTGLTNGTQYMFLVAGVDAAGNETDQADAATAGPYVPSSNSITLTPNIRGGIFRSAFFTGKNIVITVASANNGLIANDATTKFFYTLNGDEIDLTSTIINGTQGYYTFDAGLYDQVVTKVSSGTDTYLYSVVIDFVPQTGDDYTTDQTDIDALNSNTLRPSGAADHIILRMMVQVSSDASEIYEERYFIFGNAQNTYYKFSGMMDTRTGGTATYVKDGDTAGDVIFIGGSLGATGERYRTAFEHFEDILATVGSTTMLSGGRSGHRAVILDDPGVVGDADQILVLGGWDGATTTIGLATTEIFDADSGSDGFATGAVMDFGRRFHTATRLTNGEILVAGGMIGNDVMITSGAAENTEPKISIIQTSIDPSAVIKGARVEVDHGAFVDVGVVTRWVDNTASSGFYDIYVTGLTTDVLNQPYDIIQTAVAQRSVSDIHPTIGSADVERFSVAGANLADTAANMNYSRFGHTATLLQNGTVYIAGGIQNYDGDDESNYELTSEIYDPVNETFNLIDWNVGLLSTQRFFHNAVLLKDGKVLIAGGIQKGEHSYISTGYKGVTILSTAEIFDPATLSTKSVGNMTSTRFGHSMILLQSGKVLVLGGYTKYDTDLGLIQDNTAEIYDPATESFSKTGNMILPRGECAAVLVDDPNSDIYGKVVVGGGSGSTLAELYDEEDGVFTVTAHGVTGDRYVGSVATPLSDGTVLITGGQENKEDSDEMVFYIDTAEVYNTSKSRFEYLSGTSGGTMSEKRRFHTGTLLQDGNVLIAGGENDEGAISGAEIYDPVNKIFSTTASMLEPRFKHSATLLPDGTVLIAGGDNNFSSMSTIEIYDPVLGTFTSGPAMSKGRFDHQANLLPNGWVLITGGGAVDDQTIDIYNSYSGQFVTEASAATMITGRDGHKAVQQVYSVGKARFENGSGTVTGTVGTYGNAPTAWDTSGVRPGDIIICVADNTPYLIDSIDSASQITLADNPYFAYDDGAVVGIGEYAGTSTADKFTGGFESGVGFEDYVIISQDVYIIGGDVLNTVTEIFDFDPADDEWTTGNFDAVSTGDLLNDDLGGGSFGVGAALNEGRYGHTVTPLADMDLLITGGELITTGEYLNAGVWNSVNLDPAYESAFHTSFRVSNGMVITVKRHAASVFFAE